MITRAILYLLVAAILLSCNGKTGKNSGDLANEQYFNIIKKNDIGLSEPREGEWRFRNKETGQSFKEYQKIPSIRHDSSLTTIYLKPIGTFTLLQWKAIRLTLDYLQIFFQTPTGLLNPTDDKIIPEKDFRTRDNHQQIRAGTVLNILEEEQKPANTLALMAITEKDLFPSETWNYIFGLASYTKKIGVSSIYRLQNKKLDSLNFNQCLKRLINISSHEIGHMFMMKHCTFARCVMNGSNGLHETDLSPNRLCSECQRKLQLARGFDPKKRLLELTSFFKHTGLKSDFQYLLKDLESLQ